MRAIAILMLASMGFAQAQPYVEGGNTRHRFAQLTLGADFRHHFSVPEKSGYQLNPLNESRIIIGGTHFWGHADFYIAIPVAQFGNPEFTTGTETGLRFFPLRIEDKKLRPFLGASWQPTSVRVGEGAQHVQNQFPLQIGAAYNRNNLLFDFTFGFFPENQTSYYLAPSEKIEINTSRFFVSLSAKWMIDGTLGAEKDWKSGRTKLLTDTLAKLKRLDGFTVAIGPSSGIFLGNSEYNTNAAPHLHQHRFTQIFADMGVGYYFHKPDVHLNLAFRRMHSTQEAYGHEQHFSRTSLTLEGYKFLFDYHGFVPFVGPALSHEWLRVREEFPNGESLNMTRDGFFPGLTFGWDIRPNRLQTWYLRTNLRWFPGLSLSHENGMQMNFSQLEFNFIQLVIFPGRLF